MAQSSRNEALTELLTLSLARIVEFIKFSETKNAALLTFSSAWLLAILALLSTDKKPPGNVTNYLPIVLPLFVIAALVAMASFLPRLSLGLFRRNSGSTKNLLYFGDVATIPIESFRQQLVQRYADGTGVAASDNYVADLCEQIAVNSRIANRKFVLFNVGASFVFAALALLLVAVL